MSGKSLIRDFFPFPYLFTAFLLLIMFLGTSCQKSQELSLTEDKLVLVMTDVFMAEASMQRMTAKVKDTLSQRYYREIFEVHQIKKEEYLENLKALEQNPELAKKVFDAVLGKVGEIENENENEKVGEDQKDPTKEQ